MFYVENIRVSVKTRSSSISISTQLCGNQNGSTMGHAVAVVFNMDDESFSANVCSFPTYDICVLTVETLGEALKGHYFYSLPRMLENGLRTLVG